MNSPPSELPAHSKHAKAAWLHTFNNLVADWKQRKTSQASFRHELTTSPLLQREVQTANQDSSALKAFLRRILVQWLARYFIIHGCIQICKVDTSPKKLLKVITHRWRETQAQSAHLSASGRRACAELSKEKVNMLSSGAIITNLTHLPTRVSPGRQSAD